MPKPKDETGGVMFVVHRPLHIQIQPCSSGGFYGTVDELPGCGSQGDTIDECVFNVQDAINAVLAVRIDDAKSTRIALRKYDAEA